MNKLVRNLLAVLILLGGAGIVDDAWARGGHRGGHGHGGGHGFHGGHGSQGIMDTAEDMDSTSTMDTAEGMDSTSTMDAMDGSHGFHRHHGFRGRFGLGATFIFAPYRGYYPYYAPSRRYTQPQYWYYCTDPPGYYPYVTNCRAAWLPVVPHDPPP